MATNPTPRPLPAHIPTSDEEGALLIESVKADGTITIRDANGQMVTGRFGLLPQGNDWAVVLVGPGSG